MAPGCVQVLRWLHHTLNSYSDQHPQGMRVICVLTKADKLNDSIETFRAGVGISSTMQQMRQCVHQEAGLPMNQVLPVVSSVNLLQCKK
jgi:hypothetical protein